MTAQVRRLLTLALVGSSALPWLTGSDIAYAALGPAPSSAVSAATAAPAVAADRFCKETLPEGRKRPNIVEKFPERTASGFAAPLEVTVEHEAQETVMPGAAEFQLGSDDAALLGKLGFVLPSPKGPSKLLVEPGPKGNVPSTKVTLPLLVLPKEPGRKTLMLPSLPITIARRSGDVFTVCTSPHTLVVEDPTASTPDAKPKPNPKGFRQEEEWTALKQALQIGAIALVIGALLASAFFLWKRRPKRLPPPPPPRPPWEVAMEELTQIRLEDLIQKQRFAEHYDRVSDTVRKYLGARYGFDGLETTTKEMLGELRLARVDLGTFATVELFLRDADLVKFAKRTPTEAECVLVLDQAEGFVRTTLPEPEDSDRSLEAAPTRLGDAATARDSAPPTRGDA